MKIVIAAIVATIVSFCFTLNAQILPPQGNGGGVSSVNGQAGAVTVPTITQSSTPPANPCAATAAPVQVTSTTAGESGLYTCNAATLTWFNTGNTASTPATSAPICGTGSANATQACTASPIVAAIGSTPVTNATNATTATNAGHATTADSATSATTAANTTGINGASVPATAVLGSNSSNQTIDISGSVVQVSGKSVQRDIQSPRDSALGGAKGDGQQSTVCTWSASGTSVSCPDTTFVTGKLIVLRQAGAAVPGSNGSAPYSSLYAFQDISTTISSVTGSGNGNTANLATTLTTASGSGTGTVVWGTDDQTALTSAFSVPGNLTIPAGIFMHSGILSMVSGLNLFCSPGSAFQGTTAASAAFSIQSGVANVSINNCTTQGTVTSRQTSGNSSGVLISNASLTVAPFNILLNNLTIKYFSGAGMYISAGNAIKILGGLVDTVLSNSLYVAGGAGAGASGIASGIYMTGHTARNIGDMAWEFTASSSTTQTAYGTVDASTVENGLAGGGLSDGSAHIIFQGNRVKNVVASGFTCFIDQFSPVFSPADCQVNNNFVQNADSLGSGTNGGILIINLASGKFQGNEIRDSTGFGIEERQSAPSSELVIQHNKFVSLGKQAIHITGNVNGLDIQNNTATSTGPLIQIEQQTALVQNCTVKGNTGRSITVGSATFGAVDIVGVNNCNGSGNDVQGLIGAAAGVLRVASATNSTITTTQTPSLPLAQPTAPTVTPTGGAAGSYTYATVCYLPDGTASTGGITTPITNGPTTLGISNYNTITPGAETNASFCAIYRTAGGSTQGKLPGFVAPLSPLVDNGLVADGSTIPTGPTAGVLYAGNSFLISDGGCGTSGLVSRGSGSLGLNLCGSAAIIGSNAGVLQIKGFTPVGSNQTISGFNINSPVNAVASSATPVFNLTLGTYQTNTLTANVTSSTATGLSTGSQSYFRLTENSTGGFSYVWPTNIKGAGPINTAANAVNVVGTSCFDTSNCYATGPVMDQAGNGYFAGNVFANGQQSAIGFSSAAVTLTPGTNITSVTCTSTTCDVNGGSLSIVGGALASTGTFATVSYTALTTAPRVCTVSMNGGATFLGLGHGTPSTTSFTLTSAISVAATTFTMDYTCKP